MFLFVIPVLLLASCVQSIEYDIFRPAPQSAASDAQIRFAIENKYDDTGPGAKKQEFAYDTYKTLEDALVGYIDDPDTKLPEQEKAKGVQNLYKNLYKAKFNYNYRTIQQSEPVQQLPSYSKNVLYNSGANLPVFTPNEQKEIPNQIPPSIPREEFGLVSDVEKQREDLEQEKAKGVQNLYKNLYKDKFNDNYRAIQLSEPVQQLPSYSKNVLYNSGVNLPVFTPDEQRERPNQIPPSIPREEFGLVSEVEKQREDLFNVQKYQILPSPHAKEEFSFAPDVEKQRLDPAKVQKYQTFPTPVREDFGLAPEEEKQRADPFQLQNFSAPPERETFGFVPEVGKQRTDQFKRQKYHSVKSNPLNLAHFKRDQEVARKEFDPNPNYSFSYGVHDKVTGDSKSAHESRDGDKVTGFYTFMDADGKQRSVHYTADDKQGFRAVVRRTASNRQ